MLYEAALAKSRHLSPRCWAERASPGGPEWGIADRGGMRTGIAQRQGNADRRWVAMGRASQLDSLVRLVQESFMAVPRVGLLFARNEGPQLLTRPCCRAGCTGYDWVSSRAAGLGVRRTQAAFTQGQATQERPEEPCNKLVDGGDRRGLMVMVCKSKKSVMKIARIRLGQRTEWMGGRANAGGQPRHGTGSSGHQPWGPCGVGRFSGSRHASPPIKTVLGVLQIRDVLYCKNTCQFRSNATRPSSPGPERRLGRRGHQEHHARILVSRRISLSYLGIRGILRPLYWSCTHVTRSLPRASC